MKTIRFASLDPALAAPAAEYCRDVGLALDDSAAEAVVCSLGKELSLTRQNGQILLTYTRRNEFFRMLSFLPAFLEDGKEIHERARYSLLTYMGDCSRGAVYNVPFLKRFLRDLAGMGYDSMMLYTEDTYEIPEYPYFGYMRGRFSAEELRLLDDYAASFGIELIPCIQTLAHLTTALRWPDFDGYRDTPDILMVGDERTYRFIEAAVRQCAACFRSRRIHVGMDEAHLLATGEYLKRNGYRKPSDVMLEHLRRVVDICHEAGFLPMMWSDMFFRMAFGGKYYITEGHVPQEVLAKVPDGLDLVYWDYYTIERDLVRHMMECHKEFAGHRTVFAGGAWKWHGFTANNAFSIRATEIQLDECESTGVDQVIVTGWGDDGGEASQISMLPSVLYFAERCYHGVADENWLDLRARLCFGTPFDDLMTFDLPNSIPGSTVNEKRTPDGVAKYLLYNDPLERLMDRHVDPATAVPAYRKDAEILSRLSSNPRFGYAFRTLAALCRVLELKCDLGLRIQAAYSNGDRNELARLSDDVIPEILARLSAFLAAYRAQWYLENKTFGFALQEIRLGGLDARLRSAADRIRSFLAGEIDSIEELEQPSLPFIPKEDGQNVGHVVWTKCASAFLKLS